MCGAFLSIDSTRKKCGIVHGKSNWIITEDCKLVMLTKKHKRAQLKFAVVFLDELQIHTTRGMLSDMAYFIIKYIPEEAQHR